MNGTMERIVNRAAEYTGAYGRTRTGPERVSQLALANLSAAGGMHQLELFATWCYTRSDNGLLVHILPNGQIPTGAWSPWGSSGKSGMTRTDRDLLRDWLTIAQRKGWGPVWVYLPEQRRWYVDLTTYPTVGEAHNWLRRRPLTGDVWLQLQQRRRNGG